MSNVTIELLDYVYDGSNIDWDKSVVGTLDISNNVEFPLSLTFAISDIRDINSRKGSFSKTFKIPATKNNNQLYKSVYIINSTNENNISSKKPCRILINNLYSINGLLQLKSIGTSDKPLYYSCVFYGDNLGWATNLGEKLLKDLGADGDAWDNLKGTGTGLNLQIDSPSISSTWVQDNAIYKNQNNTANDFPVVYPVVSYGDFNTSGDARTIQLLDTAKVYLNQPASNKTGYVGTNNNGFNYGTPEPVVDWRPCLWVYDVFKEIFNQAGYTVVSNFIETEMFKKLLFSLPNFKYNNPDERYNNFSFQGRFNANRSANSARVFNNGGSPKTTSFTNSAEALVFDEVIYPYGTSAGSGGGTGGFNLPLNGGSGYNTGQDIWYAQEFGKYDINLENWSLNIKDISNGYTTSFGNNFDIIYKYVRVQVQKLTVGQTHWQDIGYMEGGVDLALPAGNSHTPPVDYTTMLEKFNTTIYLNKGDQVRLHLKVLAYPNKSSFTNTITATYQLFAQHNTNISARNGIYDIAIQPEYTQYGQTYDLKNVINKDYKQIDFIKGISHAFNLQFTSDEISKTVYIEPFDTFYNSLYEAIDWTDKLDIGKEATDKWLNTDIKRDIIFKYKTDSKDEKVRQRAMDYFKEILDEYPYYETLSDEFERGTTTFENPFFAGTFNAKDLDSSIGSADPPYLACLWKEKEEGGFISPNDFARPDKGFDFLPRLLHWKNYTASGLTFDTGKFASVQTWTGTNKSVAANSDLTIGGNVLFNRYPQATSVNRDDSTSPVLTYGNVYVRDFTDNTDEYSAYQIGKGLYETYYKQMVEMYKYNPRVKEAYINLKIKDVVNLDFRKLIYIDGVYYRLNKIIDFMPNNNKTTKVELIEFPLLGEFASSIPRLNENDGNWGNSESTFNNYTL